MSNTTETALQKNAFGIYEYDLSLYRGDTFAFAVNLFDGDKAMDLTGYEIRCQVKPRQGEIIEPSVTAENNRLIIRFEHELTRDVVWQDGVYDVQLKSADPLDKGQRGIVKTILRGRVNIMRDVTR